MTCVLKLKGFADSGPEAASPASPSLEMVDDGDSMLEAGGRG